LIHPAQYPWFTQNNKRINHRYQIFVIELAHFLMTITLYMSLSSIIGFFIIFIK
jgi:hypothetical protein